MADEQYEWLDKDAAERLLRGEPVDPVDGHARTEAARLMAALAAARGARPADGELPGEAAALAAFRAVPRASRTRARSETQAAGTAQATGHATQSSEPEQTGQPGRGVHPGLPETLGAIRIRPASSAQSSSSFFASSGGGMRPRRWRRPLHFGLAASLAGFALGGVAVAAGTGVLPGPFGGHADPLPASSVSAPASPGELGSGPTSDRTPVPSPVSPGPDSSPDPAVPSAPGDGTRTGDGGANDQDGRGGTDGDGHGNDVDAAPRSGDGTARDSTSGGGRDGTSGKWLGRTVRACRDYREGDLDADRRRRLVVMARGAGNLDRFCKRVLERPDGDGGDAQQGSGDGSGSGEGTGKDGPDAVRSLWFEPATAPPSAPVLSVVPGTTASTR
ncbi:hypothetical protein ACIA8E_16755 [Streptomyces sp. NPDC051664]|uniref:hypothetical protein n=1 Tax=Streptomyces sp. NPDC051664 TaxID=3365668 RepID=UPI0037898069